MALADILDENIIDLHLKSTTKDEVLRDLSAHLLEAGYIEDVAVSYTHLIVSTPCSAHHCINALDRWSIIEKGGWMTSTWPYFIASSNNV